MAYDSPDAELYPDTYMELPMPKEDPNKPKLPPDILEQERKALFERGSDFKPAHRSEIVGIDIVIERLGEAIHWLRHADYYTRHNARLEPGILFDGPPGTGKTLTARYVATESEAHFISVRDFPHNHAFMQDRDIAALFRLAREYYAANKKPVVLFWDEFEGSARDRGGHGASLEQIAAVSQLTSELDGVQGKNEGILMIGATNYGDSIDQALLRPGRLGLHIEFKAPDREGKKMLLDHYLQGRITSGEIDTDALSHLFRDNVTAAEIEEALMDAWRYAVRRSYDNDNPALEQKDLIEIFVSRMIGPPPSFTKFSHEDKLRVAVHEAGHGIAALVFGIPLKLITVRAGKATLGSTFTAQIHDHLGTIREYLADLRVGAGSLMAEKISGLGIGNGYQQDTRMITAKAIQLVDTQGQGDQSGLWNPLGIRDTRQYNFTPTISEGMLTKLDGDVQLIIDEALEDCHSLFVNKIGREHLIKIAGSLAEAETMTGPEFEEMVSQYVDLDGLRRRRWLLDNRG